MSATIDRPAPVVREPRRYREPVWTWVVLAALLAMASFVGALLLAHVRQRGALVDWLPGYDVAAVELFGVRFHRELIDVGSKDLLTAVGFVGIAVLTAGTAAILWRREGRTERVVTFAIVAAGAVFLAVDEVASVHETVGLNLGAVQGIPLLRHPDDAIVAVYGVLVVVFAATHWRVFLASAAATWCFAMACVLAIGAVLLDRAPSRWSSLEETLEMLTVAIGGLGVLLLVARHLRTAPPGNERRPPRFARAGAG